MHFIFLKSILVGFIISVPIGPVGILCLQRLITRGPLVGFFSGLGAACADVIYALIAAGSLRLLGPTIHEYEYYFRIIGSITLCILGISILMTSPEKPGVRAKDLNLRQAFFSTFFIVLSNPALIFFFLALFSMTNISTAPWSLINAVRIGLGVFCGSTLWWALFGALSHKYTLSFNQRTLRTVNTIAGSAILIFGIIGLGIAYFKSI